MNSSDNISGDSSPWLIYLDKRLSPEALEDWTRVDSDILNILRNMLLALGNAETAANEAVQRIQKCYTLNYLKEEAPERKEPDHGAKLFIHSLCTFIFELASHIPYAGIKHEALARLIVGLKDKAAQEFNEEDPQLLYDNEALLWVAEEKWNRCRIHSVDKINNLLEAKCNVWINTAAFLARLVDADMLGIDGVRWAAFDVEEGLGGAEDDKRANDQIRCCRAVVAAQYIQLAGSVIAREIKVPTSQLVHPKWVPPMDKEKWDTWATQLNRIANSEIIYGAEYGLKSEVRKAHVKMMDITAALFSDDTN